MIEQLLFYKLLLTKFMCHYKMNNLKEVEFFILIKMMMKINEMKWNASFLVKYMYVIDRR